MKKSFIKYFLLFTFVFFCHILNSYATSYVIFQDALNIRKGPDTSYGKYTTGKLGSKYYLKNDTIISDTSGGCPSGWYEINYNGSSAYVCSEHVRYYDGSSNNNDNVSPTNTCEVNLQIKGFTSSYFVPLCKLQSKHSNWNFEAISTGLDFNVVVTQESKCGKSYIETYDSNYYDSTCKSAYSSSSIWKPASFGAVRYYIDPRNFLDEKYIFMFETLSYMDSLSDVYTDAVSSVLKNAAFYQYHGSNLSTVINDVGKELNVSPTFISSRILQEIGTSNSLYNLYSGVYPGFENYYNFYNYGVSDACAATKGTTVCGLESAQNNNWKGLNNAIKGGISSISKNYIQVGQNTRYLQKFNVAPSNTNSIYTHQYMTNIRAPYGEASTAYNSYKNSDSLNSSFSFSIPVYENMPAYTELPTSASDNINNGADNSGASNSDVSNLSPASIITSSGYKYNGNYLTNINPETKVEDLISNLEGVAGSNKVTVKNAKGNTVTNGKLGTGYKITITGSSTNTYECLIYGDPSGDGNVNALDLLLIQRHILKSTNLINSYNKAADINHDGVVNVLDLLLIQRHILKAETISQG
ncbi:MAG: dockerin type I domain-containing protein [Ruminococcus sp.]|nr:dockerin type I domain-containing protein [Ruminococcus sp.]